MTIHKFCITIITLPKIKNKSPTYRIKVSSTRNEIHQIHHFFQAEECLSEFLNEIADLEYEKYEQEKQIIILNLKLQQIENRSFEIRQAQEKKFVEEMEVLEKLNSQMKVNKTHILSIIIIE